MNILESEVAFFSPKLTTRRVSHGCAVFAQIPVRKGEVLAIWGGQIITTEQFMQMSLDNQRQVAQIDDDLFIFTPTSDEPADCFNHSCHPNAGMRGQIVIVAMRDIAPGEEVTFDYAMCDSQPYDEFECQCGALECRGRVTGNDWKRPELWARYDGYFSAYLQKRIDALRGKK